MNVKQHADLPIFPVSANGISIRATAQAKTLRVIAPLFLSHPTFYPSAIYLSKYFRSHHQPHPGRCSELPPAASLASLSSVSNTAAQGLCRPKADHVCCVPSPSLPPPPPPTPTINQSPHHSLPLPTGSDPSYLCLLLPAALLTPGSVPSTLRPEDLCSCRSLHRVTWFFLPFLSGLCSNLRLGARMPRPPWVKSKYPSPLPSSPLCFIFLHNTYCHPIYTSHIYLFITCLSPHRKG